MWMWPTTGHHAISQAAWDQTLRTCLKKHTICNAPIAKPCVGVPGCVYIAIHLTCRFIQIKFVWVDAGAVLYKATLSALPAEYYSLRTRLGVRQSLVDGLVLLLAAVQAVFVAQGIRDRLKHSKIVLAKLVSLTAATPVALLATRHSWLPCAHLLRRCHSVAPAILAPHPPRRAAALAWQAWVDVCRCQCLDSCPSALVCCPE